MDEVTVNTPSAENVQTEDYEKLFQTEQSRRRGMQSENAKLKNELKTKEILLESLQQKIAPQLSTEQKEELADLQYTDPDAYYIKRQNMEREVKESQEKEIESLSAEAQQEVAKKYMMSELDKANEKLASRYDDYSKVATQEALAEEVPPRIKNKFLNGDITAEEYLEQSYKFIKKDKQIVNPEVMNQPDLTSVAGGAKPTDQAVGEDLETSYENTIY